MAKIVTNEEIARTLRDIADRLEAEDVAWKPRAYTNAAETVESLPRPLSDILNEGGVKALDALPGVGASIAGKIEELVRTGRLRYLDRLAKRMPVDMEGLVAIEGVGPKTVKALWKGLKVKDVRDLEAAIRAGKLRGLPHLGAGTERKILRSIEFRKRSRGRFPLGSADPIAADLVALLERVPGVKRAVVAGSYRRRQETVGDLDILAVSESPERAIEAFCRGPAVREVTGRGPTKASARLAAGLEVDLRVLPERCFGAALQYFTGDKDHNVAVRKIAIAKGLKLSEYGLFRGRKMVAGATEEEVYAALGLDWMPPEIRTASGEIEAAAAHRLPDLVPYGSLAGDLQVQTSWTDGEATIARMAAAAKRAGLSYLAITDHTRSLAMAHGLDERGLARQGKEIDALNRKLEGFRVLKGAEVNVMRDGKLDVADEALSKLDVVGVAVHSDFHLGEKEMTERTIRALKNPNVDVLFHATGRLIGRREPLALDMGKVLRAAKRYGVAVEVNGSPERLDIKDVQIREAVKLGVKLVVDSDAHAPSHFRWLELGLAQARRGWATKEDVLNTLPCDEFLEALRKLKTR